MADVRKHMIFHGRVQGVGFRYTAKYLARSMNLTGWVKNLTDGRVEAELQGQAELVDSFVERISQRGRIVVEFVEEEDRELAMRKALRSGEKLQSTDRGRRRCSARNRIGRNGVGEALRCTWRDRPADCAAAHGCAFRRSEHQPRIFASGVLLLRLPAVI